MPYTVFTQTKDTKEFRLWKAALVSALLLAAPVGVAIAYARLDETVSARGAVELTVLIPVTTRVAARIEKVRCREGQTVAKGDVLFELYDVELRAQRDVLRERIRGLTAERERLEERRRIVRDQRQPRELAHAQRELELLEVDAALKADLLAAREQLRASRAISEEDLKVARRDHVYLLGELRAKRAGLEMLAAVQAEERNQLDGELARTADELAAKVIELTVGEQALADTTVRAPSDGVLVTPEPEALAGRRFEPGAPIVHLGDPGALRFVARVQEYEISKLQPGQDVLVQLDPFPFYVYRTFRGKVATVASVAGSTTASTGRSEYRVLIDLADPAIELEVNGVRRQVALRAGLSGDATIVVNPELTLLHYLFRKLERHLPSSTTAR